MQSKARGGELVRDGLIAANAAEVAARAFGQYHIDVVRNGIIIDRFTSKNLIVNQGLTYKTGVALLGVTQIALANWYLQLISGTPTIAAADTYQSHAGWTEVTNYDEATREQWVGVAGAAGVATNAASRAEFTISSGGATVGGIALGGGATTPGTKGNVSAGNVLFSASAFSGGNRVLLAADILRVTWAYTFANAA